MQARDNIVMTTSNEYWKKGMLAVCTERAENTFDKSAPFLKVQFKDGRRCFIQATDAEVYRSIPYGLRNCNNCSTRQCNTPMRDVTTVCDKYTPQEVLRCNCMNEALRGITVH